MARLIPFICILCIITVLHGFVRSVLPYELPLMNNALGVCSDLIIILFAEAVYMNEYIMYMLKHCREYFTKNKV